MSEILPLIAIVGRPNVGKSTLYNRLVGGRPALVENIPGVTRDRRYGEADLDGRRFRVVDTGGMDPDAATGVIQEGIHRQAQVALGEADLIIFVVDVRDGLTPGDRDIAKMLRHTDKPILVVANKVDNAAHEALAGEIYELDLGDVFTMSATHGRGARELIDAILAQFPERQAEPPPKDTRPSRFLPHDSEEEPTESEAEAEGPAAAAAAAEAVGDHAIRLAFCGRPNVGKSSLVNRLLGEERVLVHNEPGTTTDPVDTPFELFGHKFVLVDTAGIRRRARVEEPTEKISVSMALAQIERCDVAALVIDGNEGAAEQDAKIAGAIEEAGRAVIIIVNKDDLLGTGKDHVEAEKRVTEKIRDTLPFLSFAPIRFVSAKTGHGVTELVELARASYLEHGKRIRTAELNRFYAEVCETHPPPTFHGRSVRIFYLSQPAVHPPTFVLWANRPELVHYSYRRFLMNQMRDKFGFEGTPLRFITRRREKS